MDVHDEAEGGEELELSEDAHVFIAGWLASRRIRGEPREEEFRVALNGYMEWIGVESRIPPQPNG